MNQTDDAAYWSCGLCCLAFVKTYWKTLVILLTPLVLCFLLFLPAPDSPLEFDDALPDNLGPAYRCAFVVLLMATYWSTMVLPLPITALLPLFLLPILGILDTVTLAKTYFQNPNMMFWCGLAFAVAIEESKGHIRIALRVVLLIGTKSVNLIMLGLVCVTAFMSFWISNTACAALMIPIVQAIANSLPSRSKADGIHLCNTLLLSIAYASSIGGAGVEIGSPPNLIARVELDKLVGNDNGNGKLTFVTYMFFGFPLSVVNILLTWLWLAFITRYVRLENVKVKVEEGEEEEEEDEEAQLLEEGGVDADEDEGTDAVQKRLQKQYLDLGRISTYEWSMFILFVLLVMLWMFSNPKFIDGWADRIKEAWKPSNKPKGKGEEDWKGYSILSATPAVFVLVLLFILPQKYSFFPFQDKRQPMVSQPALLTWQKIHQKVPLQVIILLGGGFALSEGIKTSGLGYVIALKMKDMLSGAQHWGISIAAQVVAILMTQVVSNSATSSILVPVFGKYAKTIHANPILFMLPVAMVSSFAFTLPVGTACNALVYEASGKTMPVSALCKIGGGMIVIHLVTMNLFINSLGIPLFDVHKSYHEIWPNNP